MNNKRTGEIVTGIAMIIITILFARMVILKHLTPHQDYSRYDKYPPPMETETYPEYSHSKGQSVKIVNWNWEAKRDSDGSPWVSVLGEVENNLPYPIIVEIHATAYDDNGAVVDTVDWLIGGIHDYIPAHEKRGFDFGLGMWSNRTITRVTLTVGNPRRWSEL
jgi:hypothetical protein